MNFYADLLAEELIDKFGSSSGIWIIACYIFVVIVLLQQDAQYFTVNTLIKTIYIIYNELIHNNNQT